MDLSTGRTSTRPAEWILRNSPVPIGTVPIYQALEKVNGVADDLSWKCSAIRSSNRRNRASIISPFTRDFCSITCRSRSRAPRASFPRRFHSRALVHGAQAGKFPYTHFREICEILAKYDVGVSLGDGLRRAPSRMRMTRRSSRNSIRLANSLKSPATAAFRRSSKVLVTCR